jgi:hypothetical protein
MMKRLIVAVLLVCGWLHAEAAPAPEALLVLTPMIGTTIDVAPYGIERVYASAALVLSNDKFPVTLWGVVLFAPGAVYFRIPLILSFHSNRYPPLRFLLGCGPGSWDHDGSAVVFPVFYGGVEGAWGGWTFTATVSEVVGSGFGDSLLDVHVGRRIAFGREP